MKILFEDKQTQPISQLLLLLGRPNMYFAAGNRKMVDAALLLASSGEVVHCYADMVWDNFFTEDVYVDLLELSKDDSKIHVHRIPCIELYALLLVSSTNVFDFKDKLAGILQVVYGNGSGLLKYDAWSFERYCKGLLNSCPKSCIRNKSEEPDGKYYTSDCSCGFPHCDVVADREIKALQLLSLLPGIGEVEQFKGLSGSVVNIEDVYT